MESPQILHLRKATDLPFQIGRNVKLRGFARIESFIEDPGVEARQESRVDLRAGPKDACPPAFSDRERQKMDDRGSTSQGLAENCPNLEILTPRQDEAAILTRFIRSNLYP